MAVTIRDFNTEMLKLELRYLYEELDSVRRERDEALAELEALKAALTPPPAQEGRGR